MITRENNEHRPGGRIFGCAILLALVSAALPGCHLSKDVARTAQPSGRPVLFRVRAPSSNKGLLSGRLLVFLKKGSGDQNVGFTGFHLQDTWVAAREISNLLPDASVELNADENAYPTPFSKLQAGDYEVQAVLDTEHTMNYRDRTAEDWASDVVSLPIWSPGGDQVPVLQLNHHPSTDSIRSVELWGASAKARLYGAHIEELVSPLLSSFWGRPIVIRAWVFVPPGYSAKNSETYPTVFWTHGFGGSLDSCLTTGLKIHDAMSDATMPPMIWVMLDESVPEGTHEFADSVNNGPWGTALTSEFLPYLEGKYRMDARPTGRLLTGHSSGGWATLQLQVNYPKIFGGTWSTSPDSSDFHDFNGVNLYAPNANLYRKPDGSPVPIVRENGEVVATMEQISRLEAVLGPYGGQFASFDWVFSPRGPDGAPVPMFDRKTGRVDPEVMAYWREHYDLAHLVEKNWPERGADLKGRIHVTVGTADTFYLDGPAHKLETMLYRLGAEPHFTYLEGRTHSNLYDPDDDGVPLFEKIGREMYAVARPGVVWKR